MRVLVLSIYFWPESFRINEVVRSLRDAGCEVTVLTGQPNYPDGDVFPGYRAWKAGREDYEGIPLYRVPLVPRGKASALRMVGYYASFVLSTCLFGPWLLRGQKFDVIFVYAASPILQVIGGRVLRFFKGAALVPWVQDLWPQSLQVTGYVRNPRVLALVAAVTRWIYRNSDLLLVQSRGFIAPVAAMAGRTPVEYHPNPGDASFGVEPTGVPALSLPPGFNVVFAGNLGNAQAMDTLLAAAARLTDLPDVRLVLVGSGNRSQWLQSEIARLGLDNVLLPGRFAAEAMPGIMRQAAALLVSLVRDPIMSQTIPSKVQTYLAAGRPIVASLDGEGARVVEESGAGFACPAEDAAALEATIRRLHALPAAELDRMGASGRQYYREHFEPATLARKLRHRFEILLGSRAHGR